MWGCFWLLLQAQKGDTYFTELAERAEYGNCDLASTPWGGETVSVGPGRATDVPKPPEGVSFRRMSRSKGLSGEI